MRLKPYKPRGQYKFKFPQAGDYWLVEWQGQRHVMQVSPKADLTWLKCGYNSYLRDVKPLKRIVLY